MNTCSSFQQIFGIHSSFVFVVSGSRKKKHTEINAKALRPLNINIMFVIIGFLLVYFVRNANFSRAPDNAKNKTLTEKIVECQCISRIQKKPFCLIMINFISTRFYT